MSVIHATEVVKEDPCEY